MTEETKIRGKQAKAAELIKMVQESEKEQIQEVFDDRLQESLQMIRERETERIGRQKYYELRDKWSKYLAGFILLTLLFQFWLTFFIGKGWIDFTDYEPYLYLIVGENFTHIIGMAVIIVKFLFRDPLEQGKTKD